MNASSISVSGLVTYWKLSWTDRERLRQALTDNGLSEDLLPEPRKPSTILRNAMTQIHGGNGSLIRPLVDGDGWEVVAEERGKDENDYTHILSARIHGDHSYDIEVSTSTTVDQRYAIVGRYDELANRLHADAVAALLTRFVTGPCHGTSLRSTGGVYWVPEEYTAKWGQIIAAVEASAVEGSNTVYLIRTARDENMVAAVRDAITHELTSAANEILADVKEDAIGERALRGRVEVSRLLTAKLKKYEAILGETITVVSDSIQTARQAASAAAVRISAEKQAQQLAAHGDL